MRKFLPATFALFLAACGAGHGGYDTPPLYNIDWVLHEIDGNEVMPDSKADLVLTPDGRFHGNTGCNAMGGQATLSGDRIAFSAAFTTKMACLPSGTMEQEDKYLAALGKVATWRLAGRVLYLKDANGNELLRFAPSGTHS